MRRTLNAIRSIDQIGPQVTFKYHDKTRIQTVFGGLLTTVMGVVGLLGLTYFSRDMVFRSNPIAKQNEILADEKVMPFADYPIASILTDIHLNPLAEGTPLREAFEVYPEYTFSEMNDSQITVTRGYFDMMPCNKEYFGRFQENYETNINVGSVCIDYSKTYNLDGSPSQVKDYFYKRKNEIVEGTVDLKVRLCDEEKKPGCSKPFLEAGQVQFFFYTLNELVDTENYENPIERRIDYSMGNVSAGLFNRKFMHISLNKLVTDDGFILSNTSTEEFLKTSLYDNNVTAFNTTTRNLFSYQFNMTINEQVLERRYVKVQEILANIGGFMKLLFFCSSFLSKYFALFSFYKQYSAEINEIVGEIGKNNKAMAVNNLIKPNDKSGNQSSTCFVNNQCINKSAVKGSLSFVNFASTIMLKRRYSSDTERVFRFLDIKYLTRKMIELEILNAKLT